MNWGPKMNSKQNFFQRMRLKVVIAMTFATFLAVPVGYAGGTVSSGDPDEIDLELVMTVDELDAWSMRVSVTVKAFSVIPDVSLRVATGGVAGLNTPAFPSVTVPNLKDVFGLPLREIEQTNMGTLSPEETIRYTFLLPFDQAGQASIVVTAFTESSPGFVRSAYVHRMFIADGRRILDDQNLLKMRVRALEERLRAEGVSETEIAERVRMLTNAATSVVRIRP